MRFEQIIEKVDEKELKKLYLEDLLSLDKISDKLDICQTTLKQLLVYYKLERDNSKVKSQAQLTKETKFKQNQQKITRDILYDWYVTKDNSYKDAPSYFNISQYQFDKLCKEYNIKKDKSLVNKKKLENKYQEFGSKENYNKSIADKRKKTQISKYGSEESYNRYISEKCRKTWANKTGKEIREHSETISRAKRSLPESAVNEAKIKRVKTLKLKYGVNNSFALATYTSNSNPNKLFEQKLINNNIDYEKEFIIKGNNKFYRYDFKIDNILIEINPWPFHNTTFNPIPNSQPIDKNYHYNKTLLGQQAGYRVINIFDWDDQDKIISLLSSKTNVGARKCELKEVPIDVCDLFLNQNHLQNTCRKQLVRLGLYYQGELIQVMTFGKPRYNKNYEWELLRLCTKANYNIIGGAEKLFNYFLNTYKPDSIISYCDISKFTGSVYSKLGFKLKATSKHSRHWYNIKTKQHITDNFLRQKGFDKLFNANYGKGTDNDELMREHNFVEIYDCGQSTYIYEK